MANVPPSVERKNKLAEDEIGLIDFSLSDEVIFKKLVEVQEKHSELMQKHFDVVLDSIAAFFLDSSYEPLSDLFKEVVMRMGGDKDVIANDYAEHSVTLGKKEELYYLIHQLGTRVKAQVWSLNGGALSDFIRNSFDDVVREIGVKGLEFIPINERDILESQFVQSEYNYQESRRKMGF